MDLFSEEYLAHHGVLGMKWGVRRYQNADGSLTAEGQKRYGSAAEGVKKGKIMGDLNRNDQYIAANKTALARAQLRGDKDAISAYRKNIATGEATAKALVKYAQKNGLTVTQLRTLRYTNSGLFGASAVGSMLAGSIGGLAASAAFTGSAGLYASFVGSMLAGPIGGIAASVAFIGGTTAYYNKKRDASVGQANRKDAAGLTIPGTLYKVKYS